MKIQLLRPNVKLPVRGTEHSGGFDIYMPSSGSAIYGEPLKIALGFKTEIPVGYVALILPRSGAGFKNGVELNNTCGVIDADYRGEWFAMINQKAGNTMLAWQEGERILQFILVPVLTPELEVVDQVNETCRGTGGLGSTGN
jgi:dUTP pyrophosphatase